MANENNNLDWLGPVLGFVGLLAGTLFMSGQQQSSQNNSLPPPPMNKKPGGCGCNAQK